MELSIGYDSKGIRIRKPVLVESHLFISFFSDVQLCGICHQLLKENGHMFSKYLLIRKKVNGIDLPPAGKNEIYVYDDPESGTLIKRAALFASVHRALKKRIVPQNRSPLPLLVIIDDIWELVPRLNKTNSSRLKDLLNAGADVGIYLLVGSSMPYRNLLLQLMQPGIKTHPPANEIGAEMIINPDNMIFFREKNQLEFANYYP